MLTKAQSYRVKNQEKNRHKDFPEASTAVWEHSLAAADSGHATPQLSKGQVIGLELLWGKSSCDLLLPGLP